MESAREIAAQILMKVLEEQEMSHLALRLAYADFPHLEGRDRRFIHYLVQGTLESLIPIDARLNEVSKVPVKKMKPWIRTILRLGTYQLLYMGETIPASAVCSESIKLAEKRKFHGLKGYVNGVLRTIARNPEIPKETLSLQYSMPQWLIDEWMKTYGLEETKQLLEAFHQKKKVTLRRNISKVSEEDLLASLEKDGAQVTPLSYPQGMYNLEKGEKIEKLQAIKKGFVQIQDVSSAIASAVASPERGACVLDVCAAPGGKTIHLADQVGSDGEVISCDVSKKKVEKIQENRDRCGFSQITLRIQDAREFVPQWEKTMDVVMADLPCSGLGTMGHKPEIRYRIGQEDIEELAKLQRQILDNVWRYVKPGGILIFSTCTMNSRENEENFIWFLNHHPFQAESLAPYLPQEWDEKSIGDGYLQILPHRHPGCDGFFISRCRRTNE